MPIVQRAKVEKTTSKKLPKTRTTRKVGKNDNNMAGPDILGPKAANSAIVKEARPKATVKIAKGAFTSTAIKPALLAVSGSLAVRGYCIVPWSVVSVKVTAKAKAIAKPKRTLISEGQNSRTWPRPSPI